MSFIPSLPFIFWGQEPPAKPAKPAAAHDAAPPAPIDSFSNKEFIFQHEDTSFLARPLLRQVTIFDKPLTGLCTVLRPPAAPNDGSSASAVSRAWLEHKIADFKLRDDVYQPGFSSNIVFADPSGSDIQLDPGAVALLQEWHSNAAFAIADRDDISEGPYYAQHGVLHAVWKLCPDTHEAFMTATLPPKIEAPKIHRKFWCSDGCRLVIGVPSRLYGQPSDAKPLEGLRISIKDNIDLEGIKTTLSCRAWETLYPPSGRTAEAVQRLTDLGAVVVGKTKMSQFAEVEAPTADWVDFHCPFNPRGDGYLTPEGSTTGGAVALAAYDWLDVSIGTDTGGSLRDPAAKQGLFGLRPTWGSLSMDGVFPLAHSLDAMGLLCRDADLLHRVTSAWFPPSNTCCRGFSNAKVISDFAYDAGPARHLFDSFVAKFTKAAAVQQIDTSLKTIWSEKNPCGLDENFAEYIGKRHTMRGLKAFDLWKTTEDFRTRYREKFGREPYVNPTVQQRWSEAREATAEEQSAALGRKKIFTNWFLESVLCTNSPTGPNTVTIVPISDEEPCYRDDYPTLDLPYSALLEICCLNADTPTNSGPWMGGTGFHQNFLSSLTGCPEVIVPIGQIMYESRVTKQKEYLPIVVGILGPPGSDLVLTQFVADSLRLAGLPTQVKTGAVAFPMNA